MGTIANKQFHQFYSGWKKRHTAIMQVSSPRSGGHWLRWIVERVSGRQCFDLRLDEFTQEIADVSDNCYFNNHQISFDYEADKYIFLVRDPRDVIMSGIRWSKAEKSVDLMNDLLWWERIIGVYRNHFDRYIDDNTLVVQYEHLCLFPVKVIERLFNFMGYDIKEDILSIVEGLDTPGYTSDVKLPFTNLQRYNAHCLHWKRSPEYTAQHNNYIWSRLGDIMIHYGYVIDGHSPRLFNL